MPAASLSCFRSLRLICAMLGAVAIAGLSGCATPKPQPAPIAPPPEPPAPHQLSADQPSFTTLPNQSGAPSVVRVGLLLPLSDGATGNRHLADAMLKAAQLALYDAGNRDILLMIADDSGPSRNAAKAAQSLLDQGAEILIGPLFQASVSAASPLARDRGVPMVAFSTDRAVAGNGVYLLSFQLQNEVERIISYAMAQGHRKFAALIPQTAYGDAVAFAYREALAVHGGEMVAVERYNPAQGTVSEPAEIIAKSGCDAVLLPQGGSLLRALAPALVYNGLDLTQVKLIGTGLWNDPANTKEPLLAGGWFAAPQPSADDAFKDRYRRTFGSEPPTLAVLAYDAVSLTAHLASGTPYHRFTKAALTDSNGFSGAGGIFRFGADGSLERGLAVLQVGPDGFVMVSPAPTTFQALDKTTSQAAPAAAARG